MLRKTAHFGFIFALLGLMAAVGWSLQVQASPLYPDQISPASTLFSPIPAHQFLPRPLEIQANGGMSGTVTDALTGQTLDSTAIEMIVLEPLDFSPLHPPFYDLENPISPDGTYQFTDIPAGRYLLKFVAQSNSPYFTEYYTGTEFAESATQISVTADTVTTIDYAMHPAGAITGVITDATTGQPISPTHFSSARAELAVPYSFPVNESIYSINEQGEYLINKLRPGLYRVNFWPSEETTYVQSNLLDPAIGGTITVSVTMGMTSTANYAFIRGGNLTGTLLDSITGQQLTSTDVSYVAIPIPNAYSETSLLNGQNQFHFAGMPAGNYTGVVIFRESSPYSYSGKISFSIGINTVISDSFTVELDRGVIRGIVDEEATNQPYANLKVSLDAIDHISGLSYDVKDIYTAADGSYEFRALPAGEYIVTFEPPNYGPDFPFVSAEHTLNITASQTVTLDHTLKLSGAIEGQITADDTGNPIPFDIHLSIWSRVYDEEAATYHYNRVGQDEIDSSGFYRVSGLAAGEYFLKAEVEQSDTFSPKYIPEGYQDVAFNDNDNLTPISVNKGQATEINVSLAQGGQIIGRLLNSQTTDPAQGSFEITVFDHPSGEIISTYTTSTGAEFTTFGLPDGDYTIHFEQKGYSTPPKTTYITGFYTQPDGLTPQIVTITNGNSVSVDIPMNPGATIAGTVTGEDFYDPTLSLSGTAYLYNSNGEEVDKQSIDPQLGYQFTGVAPGSYFLRFQGTLYSYPSIIPYVGQYYDQAASFDEATPIAVTNGDVLPNINAVLPLTGTEPLPPNTAINTVSGRVTTAANTPIPNTTITVNTGQKTSTDANGNYTLKLINGDYELTASKPGYTFTVNQLTITVDGDETDQNFTAVPIPTTSTLNGTLTDQTTADPLPNMTVSLYQQLNGLWTFVTETETDTNGSYTFSLHPAAYRLHFHDPQGSYQAEYYNDTTKFTNAQTITLTDNQTVTADAQLFHPQPAKITVSGAPALVDPETGDVTIRVVNGQPNTLTITYEPACNGASPTDVQLLIGMTLFPMSDAGNGRYTITLNTPADIASNADLIIQYKCDSADQVDSVGRIQLYDPSGLITNIQTGDIITNALVTLYRVPNALPDTATETNQCRTVDTRPSTTGGSFGPWSALPAADLAVGTPVNAEIDQLNGDPLFDPAVTTQQTDANGRYGWDVAEGCWFITVAAEGYETAVSPIVGVPPAVLDLNIALTPEDDNTPPPVEETPTIYLPLVTN